MPLQKKFIDAFNVLGLTPDIDQATASKTYKKLALLHHPDRNHGDETATQRFQEIGKAWDICLSYYKNPEAAEEGYRRPAQGYGYEFEFDEDDDIPMDAEMAEEFLRFMFEEMLKNAYSREKGRRYFHQRRGAYGANVYTYSGDFAARQAETRRKQEENARKQHEARQEYLKRVAELEAEIEADRLEAERLAKEQKRKESQMATAYHTAFREGRSGNGLAMRQIVQEKDLDVRLPEKGHFAAPTSSTAPPKPFETMLHVASARCDVETVTFFLAKGASISALNNAKLTPFHSAVLRGNAPVVKFYLEHALKYPAEQGCHPSKAAADGRTVLQLAIASKSVEVVGAVVKYATVHDVDARWRELPIIISNEKLVADIRQALLTKNGFVPPGSGSAPASTSKKAQKKQALKEQEERAKEEKARKVAEELARAEEKRKKKAERQAKKDEEERAKAAVLEAARIEAARIVEEERIKREREEEQRIAREKERERLAAEEARLAERERAKKVAEEQRQAAIIAAEKAKRDEELRKQAEWEARRQAEDERRRRRREEELERERAHQAALRRAEQEKIEQERLANERWKKWEADNARRLAEEARMDALRQAEEAERLRQLESEGLRQQVRALQASKQADVSTPTQAIEKSQDSATPQQVCGWYQRGQCKYGARCRMLHVKKERKVAPTPTAAPPAESIVAPLTPAQVVQVQQPTPPADTVNRAKKAKAAPSKVSPTHAAIAPAPVAQAQPEQPKESAPAKKMKKDVKEVDEATKRRRAEQSARDKARTQQMKEERLARQQREASEQALSQPHPVQPAATKTPQAAKPKHAKHPQKHGLPSPPMTPNEDMQTCAIPDDLFHDRPHPRPAQAPVHRPEQPRELSASPLGVVTVASRGSLTEINEPPTPVSEDSVLLRSPVQLRGRGMKRRGGGPGSGRGRSFDDHHRGSKGNLQRQLAEKDEALRRMAAELAMLKGE